MNADIDWVRDLCLSFPNATEQVTWGADLTFRISGKIFAVTVLEPAKVWLSFKCSAENFAELTERAGIIPRLTWLARNGSRWKTRTPCRKRNSPPCFVNPTILSSPSSREKLVKPCCNRSALAPNESPSRESLANDSDSRRACITH